MRRVPLRLVFCLFDFVFRVGPLRRDLWTLGVLLFVRGSGLLFRVLVELYQLALATKLPSQRLS